MTTQTGPCEEFEIAALRRTRGALDATATAQLSTHLAACSSCRRFATTAEATEAALRGQARAAVAERDWEHVRASFRLRRRSERNRKLRGLACVLTIVALQWWALGPLAGAITATFGVVVLVFAWFRYVLPRERRARQVESVDTEMLAYYRQELDEEIGGLRSSRPLVVVLLVLYAATLVLMVANVAKELVLGHGFPNIENYVATFIVFTLVGGGMWWRGRHVLPRLERERRELGE